MRILVDTNILIDWVSHRDNYQNAREIVYLCANREIEGCIAAHSVTNMFYILRKNLGLAERKTVFDTISRIFTIVPVDELKLRSAVNNADFKDFEDCLQMECAKEFGAEYIVTRNVSDFENSSINAVEPQDFLEKFKSNK
ncbi:MAG: PIN domain-containing protein [Oscillospiraceae bacterium]|nr:PIN domain-containing protein [Oscillospiraceae bacterium]